MLSITTKMVTFTNILVVKILILLCNCNLRMCQVNGCSRKDFRCDHHGPPIRFPFRPNNRETEYGCSYNGFNLSCSDTNKTLLELYPHSGPIKLEVIAIDYQLQQLKVSDPENCIPRQVLKLLKSQISPFQLFQDPYLKSNYTFLDCSSLSCPVIADSSDTLLDSGFDPILCTKTLDIVSSSLYLWDENSLFLTWSKPNCSKCEIEDKMCKLKNNGTEDEIECFDRHHKPTKKILLYATGEIPLYIFYETWSNVYKEINLALCTSLIFAI